MPNAKNKAIIETISKKVAKAKSIIFADYKGLKATEVSALRNKLREKDAEMLVSKNTLLKLALKENKLEAEELEEILQGNTATIVSYSDPISPIKELVEFAKTLQLPKIKAGFIEGLFNLGTNVEQISRLPSKKQLIAQFLSDIQSPVVGLVNVLSGSKRKLVYAFSAIADKRKEGGVANG